jgi:hypothetical protein
VDCLYDRVTEKEIPEGIKKGGALFPSSRKDLVMHLLLVVSQDGSDLVLDAFVEYMDVAFFMDMKKPMSVERYQALANHLGIAPVEPASPTEHKLLVCASILKNLCGENDRAANRMIGKRRGRRLLEDYNRTKKYPLDLDPEIASLLFRCTANDFSAVPISPSDRGRAWIPKKTSSQAEWEAQQMSSPVPMVDLKDVAVVKDILVTAVGKLLVLPSFKVHMEVARELDHVFPDLGLTVIVQERLLADPHFLDVINLLGMKFPTPSLPEPSFEEVEEEDTIWESLDMSYIVWSSKDIQQALLRCYLDRTEDFEMAA